MMRFTNNNIFKLTNETHIEVSGITSRQYELQPHISQKQFIQHLLSQDWTEWGSFDTNKLVCENFDFLSEITGWKRFTKKQMEWLDDKKNRVNLLNRYTLSFYELRDEEGKLISTYLQLDRKTGKGCPTNSLKLNPNTFTYDF